MRRIILKLLPSIMCINSAVALVIFDYPQWGWFLVAGFILGLAGLDGLKDD